MILWGAFQLAVVGLFLWIDYDTATWDPVAKAWIGRAPQPGLAITMGWIVAWVLTIIPVAIVEGIKDVRRLYLPAWRRWRSKSRGVDPVFPEAPDNRVTGRPTGDSGSRFVEHG
jgi:hypothetical protein